MSQKLNTVIAVVGIDIGKNSFHIVGHDEHGAIVLRQKNDRLRKLYGGRKKHGDLDEEADSEIHERDHRSNRNLDFIA